MVEATNYHSWKKCHFTHLLLKYYFIISDKYIKVHFIISADSSSQYDAIRAYLKELDITEKVWIGLSKTSEKTKFLWTDFRPLSGEGHWQEALPAGESQSLCAVMDPTADFLWRPLPCGGPEVAAFICELPIPSWALGPKGCLLTELPSLTVLYIPEQSALELTSDCGLDGTKRIACKGNADREEILRQLTCVISNEDMDEDKPTKTSTSDYYEISTSDENSLISKTTKTWTSNTISADYGMPTRHRRETEDTLSPLSTKSSFKEVSTKDLSWQDTHREKTVLTTQHMTALDDHVTPTPATSFDIDKITDGTTATESEPTLDNSVSDTFLSSKDDKAPSEIKGQRKQNNILMNQKTVENVITTEQHMGFTTITPNIPDASTVYPKNVTPNMANEKLKTEVLEETRNTTTQEGNVEEYPSAINQGQLFSIIENGTMFDIIELNETEPELQNNKTQKSLFAIPTNTPVSIIETVKTTTSHTVPMDASSKTKISTKKYITKKPVQPPKKYSKAFPSKKGILPSDLVTTQKPIIKIHSVDLLEENLTKEFEMMPDIKDTSLKLNRTFRKELPPISVENTGLESGSQFGVPRVLNFSITNSLDSEEERYQHDQIENKNILKTVVLPGQLETSKMDVVPGNEEAQTDAVTELHANSTKITTVAPIDRNVEKKGNATFHENVEIKTNTEVDKTLEAKVIVLPQDGIENINQTPQETSTVSLQNAIDPRIYMLNHHPNVPKNNESESLPTTKIQHPTEKSKVAKEKFLPKSLLGETNVSLEPIKQTTVHPGSSEAYTEHPFPSDEPKKINRHRSLHTNKQRKFYPYFFSRMLG